MNEASASTASARIWRSPADGVSRSSIAQSILDAIADYNRYDCVSTLRLRDWLIALS